MREHRHFGGAYGHELWVGPTTAINCLGFSSHQLWAFRRAELTGYGESPFRLESGERATLAFVPTLPPTSFGAQRMLPLLTDTLAPLAQRAGIAFGASARLGVALCLPERMNGKHALRRHALERKQLETRVLACCTDAGFTPELNVQAHGHAAGARALLWASMQLQSDALDAVIVGGVDSHYDPDVMDTLMRARRVFCSDRIEAMIPGEAASFALIARSGRLRSAGITAQCKLESVSVGEEPCHLGIDTPCLGLGLSRTLQVISDRLLAERRSLDWILGDVTNEDYRTRELQLAYPRFVRDVVQREIPLEFLPMAMGDLGAATLPTALAIAAEGLSRGDPVADTCLLFAGSDGEDRGAALASGMHREG